MQITRYGSYGILVKDSALLLIEKKSGPYQGLWDLPGGAIEFGETPVQALERELLEETALKAGALKFLNIATATGSYAENGEPYQFHHVGVLYKVHHWTEQKEQKPEDVCRWVPLQTLVEAELTPLAKYAVQNFLQKSTSI